MYADIFAVGFMCFVVSISLLLMIERLVYIKANSSNIKKRCIEVVVVVMFLVTVTGWILGSIAVPFGILGDSVWTIFATIALYLVSGTALAYNATTFTWT